MPAERRKCGNCRNVFYGEPYDPCPKCGDNWTFPWTDFDVERENRNIQADMDYDRRMDK